MDTEADLPRSNVRRIVKQKLTELKGTSGSDIHLNRDALTALGESARVFIHLLSATANDICLDKKRQTISVDDILEALEELEFSDLISQLEGDIEGKFIPSLLPSSSLYLLDGQSSDCISSFFLLLLFFFLSSQAGES